MNADTFKVVSGVLNMLVGIVGPYAAGMPFSMSTLFMNLMSAFTGGHAVVSGMTKK